MSLSNAGDEEAAAAAAAMEEGGEAEVASAPDELPTNRFDMVMKKTRGISVAPYGLLQVNSHARCISASCAQLKLSQALWCKTAAGICCVHAESACHLCGASQLQPAMLLPGACSTMLLPLQLPNTAAVVCLLGPGRSCVCSCTRPHCSSAWPPDYGAELAADPHHLCRGVPGGAPWRGAGGNGGAAGCRGAGLALPPAGSTGGRVVRGLWGG